MQFMQLLIRCWAQQQCLCSNKKNGVQRPDPEIDGFKRLSTLDTDSSDEDVLHDTRYDIEKVRTTTIDTCIIPSQNPVELSPQTEKSFTMSNTRNAQPNFNNVVNEQQQTPNVDVKTSGQGKNVTEVEIVALVST